MATEREPISFEQAHSLSKKLMDKVGLSIFGQEELITEAICCLLSGGHILMTGAPGLAKTTLVRVFAKYLSLVYGRVQFTPDLLPTDILGSDILNLDPETGKRSFDFSAGPIFVNLLLNIDTTMYSSAAPPDSPFINNSPVNFCLDILITSFL